MADAAKSSPAIPPPSEAAAANGWSNPAEPARLVGLTGSAGPVAEDRRIQSQLITAPHELLALAVNLQGDGAVDLRRIEAGTAETLDYARWAYRSRRSRSHYFGDERLFGEPAWDMLLDLYIADREGKRVPVTSACIGAAVPTTTGLRWLALLEQQGLVIREPDPADARRALVRLTTHAVDAMERFLRRAQQDAPR